MSISIDRYDATAAVLAADTERSPPTVDAALADLEGLGIVEETTGRSEAASWPTAAT